MNLGLVYSYINFPLIVYATSKLHTVAEPWRSVGFKWGPHTVCIAARRDDATNGLTLGLYKFFVRARHFSPQLFRFHSSLTFAHWTGLFIRSMASVGIQLGTNCNLQVHSSVKDP